MTYPTNITNIFGIGYRCNTDDFLSKYLNIRNYSSPFSYMVIDIKTSLKFIDEKFQNFTKNEFITPGTNTYTFNKHEWNCNNIHKYSIITGRNIDICDMETVCIWNHHNLNDKKTINSLTRRSQHLLDCLNNKPDTLLLFQIEKIQKWGENKSQFDKSILEKHKCKFLILIPLLNFNKDPILFYEDDKVKIIYFNSNLESWGTDIQCHIEEWKKLNILIKSLQNFQIEHRSGYD